MSLKTLHSIIIFAGMSISLFFAYWCFTSPEATGSTGYFIAGIGGVLSAIGFIAYEVHFLKRTRRLIIQ